ncbi:MAG: methyltransferase [Chryseolinea sp.]
MNFYEKEKLSAIKAMEHAQWIAFAPFVFQATRILRDSNILAIVEAKRDGITLDEIQQQVNMSPYAVRVLVEAGLGMGLIILNDGKYKATKTSYFILHDELTRVNMDLTQDVCYQGMYHLEESLKNGKPEGLKVLGNWDTIYEGLSTNFPPKAKKSWLAFDHYYSDNSFPLVLPLVYQYKPKRLLDIGGNTGKWSIQSFGYDPDVHITIIDLPGNVETARSKIEELGYGNRISFYPCNVLDESNPFPNGFDAIWMSQFLDCFSEEEITSILKRCRGALAPGGKIFIMELFWDRQRFEASAFSLQQTSLYFTAMANGNSQMYDSKVFNKCIEAAGLRIVSETDNIGVSHTLQVCEPV